MDKITRLRKTLNRCSTRIHGPQLRPQRLGCVTAAILLMKRTSASASNHPGTSVGASSSPSPLVTRDPPLKRPKTFKACTLCRHHKTRCDPSEVSDGKNACRRCRHFSKQCSLDDHLLKASFPETSLPKDNVVLSPRRREKARDNGGERGEFTTSVTTSFVRYIARSPFQDVMRLDGARRALAVLLRKGDAISENLDWSTTINAIHDIAGKSEPALVTPSISAHPQELEKVFRALYAPWIHWGSSRSQAATPLTFLQAVQHALAAKNPSSISQLEVQPQLELDIQAGLYRTMLGATTDLDDLRALHIFSLYSSITSVLSLTHSSDTSGVENGGEFALASALKLARTMHLERDVQKITEFRRATPSSLLHTPAPPDVMESFANCRLLFSLYITDCFMCVLKGRNPDTSQAEMLRRAQQVFGSPHALLATRQGIADARLVFLSRLCDIISRAFGVSAANDAKKYVESMCDALSELESWRTDFVTFSALTDVQSAHENQLVLLQFTFCKLSLMARAILAIIKSAPEGQARQINISSLRTPVGSPYMPRSWVAEIVVMAESFVATTLALMPFTRPSSSFSHQSQPQPASSSHPLATAPDYILSMVAFATFILVKTQLHRNRVVQRTQTLQAAQRAGERTRWALLKRLSRILTDAASEGGELAGRYAAALEVFLGILDEDRPKDSDEEVEFEGTLLSEEDLTHSNWNPSSFNGPDPGEEGFGLSHGSRHAELGGGSSVVPMPPLPFSFSSDSLFLFDFHGADTVLGAADLDDLFDRSFDQQFAIDPMSMGYNHNF